jgi:Sigma-70 region 2
MGTAARPKTRASLRDPEQFATLYDRYSAVLHRYAGGRVGGEDAEDVVAATFLAAFRARPRYDLARPDARPWPFSILTKEIARRRRTERAPQEPRSGCQDTITRWPQTVHRMRPLRCQPRNRSAPRATLGRHRYLREPRLLCRTAAGGDGCPGWGTQGENFHRAGYIRTLLSEHGLPSASFPGGFACGT